MIVHDDNEADSLTSGAEQATVAAGVRPLDADAAPRADARAGGEAAALRAQPARGPREAAAPDGAQQPGRVHAALAAGAEEEARAGAEAAAQEPQAEGGHDPEAVPGHVQDPDEAVQGAQGAGAADDAQGGAEDRHQEAEGGAEEEDGAARGAVRADHRRHAPKAIGEWNAVEFDTKQRESVGVL